MAEGFHLLLDFVDVNGRGKIVSYSNTREADSTNINNLLRIEV